MTDWSRGYVADIPYPIAWRGFFAPLEVGTVAALMGVAWEPPADCAIAELGCGRGFTPSVLAAGDPRRTVLGVDYNPAQIAEARGLAEAAGVGNVRFLEADLAALTDAELDRLPEFDLIALHGVWTWIADAVREGIVRFIARRLKPGGMVYVGYNSLPGFSAETAFQRLMRTAAAHATGDSIERVRAAIATVRRLAATEPAQLPRSGMLQRVTHENARTDPAYLAHEFLTAHWRPVFFADLMAALAAAKCDFVGSLNLWENLTELALTAAQSAEYEALPDLGARELIKDICLTRPFRRDVFVRGVRRVDREAALERIVVALARMTPETLPKLAVQHGTAELPADVATPILAALAEGPQPIGRLRRLPATQPPGAAELAVLLLSDGLCVPYDADAPASPAAQRLNIVAAERYADGGRARLPLAVAAPRAGGGLSCSALELALVGWLLSGGDPAAPPNVIARDLLPDLNDTEEAEIGRAVAVAMAERLPIWQRFGAL